MERFTIGGHGFPFSAPMFLAAHHAQQMASATQPSPQPAHQHGQMTLPNASPAMFAASRFTRPIGVPTYNFSQEEVDSVLYGYTKSSEEKYNGHALSGLRLGDISHGKFDSFILYFR